MNNSFRYICREGVQTYKTFLRRGLKYSWLVLRNFDKPVRIRLFRVAPIDLSANRRRLVRMLRCQAHADLAHGVRSVECCSEDTYTDCPTYEQTFWVGDARNEALVDLIANGDARLSERCLRLTGRSLDRSSITESQVPSGWQNLLPTWTALWMRWTQEHYQLTGDKEFAREMLNYLDRNFTGIQKEINADGLFNLFAWNLFDWAAMDTPANGIVTHINCLLSQALSQTAELARDLGEQTRAKNGIRRSRLSGCRQQKTLVRRKTRLSRLASTRTASPPQPSPSKPKPPLTSPASQPRGEATAPIAAAKSSTIPPRISSKPAAPSSCSSSSKPSSARIASTPSSTPSATTGASKPTPAPPHSGRCTTSPMIPALSPMKTA